MTPDLQEDIQGKVGSLLGDSLGMTFCNNKKSPLIFFVRVKSFEDIYCHTVLYLLSKESVRHSIGR